VCGDNAAFLTLNQTPNIGTTALCSWLYQNFTGSRRPVHIILNNQLTLYALACKFPLLLLCWPELDHCRFSGRSLDGCQRVCRFCEKKHCYVEAFLCFVHVLQYTPDLWVGMAKCGLEGEGSSLLATPAQSSGVDEHRKYASCRVAVRQVGTIFGYQLQLHRRQTLSCFVAAFRLSSLPAVRVLATFADVLCFVTLKVLCELLRELLHDHPIILGHDAVSPSSRISTFRDNVLLSPSTVNLSLIVNHLWWGIFSHYNNVDVD